MSARSYRDNQTGWLVGIVVAVFLLAVAYLVFSANSISTGVNGPQALDLAAVVADPETGCEYLVLYGYYPRLGPDGKQICRTQP